LKPSDAWSSVILVPVTGSIGSIFVTFVFRFGFDAIFDAIGLSVVTPVGVGAGPVCTETDVEPDALAPDVVACLPAVDFAGLVFTCAEVVVADPLVVGFVGSPALAGFPLLCAAVDAADLPLIDAPVVVGLAVVVGLPAVVGLPVVVGLPDVVGLWP
jgi:hypothetical protein